MCILVGLVTKYLIKFRQQNTWLGLGNRNRFKQQQYLVRFKKTWFGIKTPLKNIKHVF